MWTVELLVIVAMITLNSVFAGYEIALASVGLGRLHALAEAGRRGAHAAQRMKQGMEASLAVVQLGITLVGVVAAATGGAGAGDVIEPVLLDWGFSPRMAQFLAIAVVVAPLTVFTIIFGELVPKVFSLRNPEWVCLKLSPAMEWFAYCVWPMVWFLESSVSWIMKWGERGWKPQGSAQSEEGAIQELRGTAALARMTRLIGHREEGIIVSASRLSTTPVRKIMLPTEYIGYLSADQSLSEALISAHKNMHTRFPVSEVAGDPQRIFGYVNFKDIISALRLAPHDPSLRSLVRRIREFDADTSVADCLEHLMREHSHIAMVRDRGTIVGMITLEDIIEELVGEIHDEYDRVPAFLTPAGNGWIAGGFVPLAKLRETTGLDFVPLGEKPIYTLNDWIAERLDGPPTGGDVIKSDTCRVVIRKTMNMLIQEAFVSGIDATETDEESPKR